MEDKTRKLLMTLEYLALVVSILLVLIDYKLKRDLLQLFIQIERDLYGKQPEPDSDGGNSTGPDNLRAGNLVANDTGMETPGVANAPGAAGEPGPGAGGGNGTRPKRSAGTRNTPVQVTDKQVGP
jgi:hypothetical protein